MSNNIVVPDFSLRFFTCPHCHVMAQMEYQKIHFQQDVNLSLSHNSIENSLEDVILARCENCGKKIIWIGDTFVYPDTIAEEPCCNMPEDVLQLYQEAGAISKKSPRAACALLRLAIDRLCNDLDEKDRNINENIKALVSKGLPVSVQQALDVVRVVGNRAVHPGQIYFDVDDINTANLLMHLLNVIVERMITEPKEINELYQHLPENIRQSISNRDKSKA